MLIVYNFTLYESPGARGVCYLWSEVDGHRGSDEIGSCLLSYLQSLPEHVKKIDFFSDNCRGQNKNIQIAAVCLYAVKNIDHLDEIVHTFLENGHTMMKCDSMHAAVEFAKRNMRVESMQQWETVLQLARRKNPYEVN